MITIISLFYLIISLFSFTYYLLLKSKYVEDKYGYANQFLYIGLATMTMFIITLTL